MDDLERICKKKYKKTFKRQEIPLNIDKDAFVGVNNTNIECSIDDNNDVNPIVISDDETKHIQNYKEISVITKLVHDIKTHEVKRNEDNSDLEKYQDLLNTMGKIKRKNKKKIKSTDVSKDDNDVECIRDNNEDKFQKTFIVKNLNNECHCADDDGGVNVKETTTNEDNEERERSDIDFEEQLDYTVGKNAVDKIISIQTFTDSFEDDDDDEIIREFKWKHEFCDPLPDDIVQTEVKSLTIGGKLQQMETSYLTNDPDVRRLHALSPLEELNDGLNLGVIHVEKLKKKPKKKRKHSHDSDKDAKRLKRKHRKRRRIRETSEERTLRKIRKHELRAFQKSLNIGHLNNEYIKFTNEESTNSKIRGVPPSATITSSEFNFIDDNIP